MNLDQIDLQGFILALFIRDDGERFLLGSGIYEFVKKQLHFKPNTFQSDIVEVQGNDGVLLAGQVRRATAQDFDGYIGDSTVGRTDIETYRRAFLAFFRKNYYYTVVYIFPNGSAIQRKKGFIVDAPEVQELYQIFPEYHVSLNFEDVNYYSYSEDDEGHEIYGKSAIIPLSVGAKSGGLEWDEYGAICEGITWSNLQTVSGLDINITNTANFEAPVEDVKLYGDTTQQTYSGKNLASLETSSTKVVGGLNFTTDDGYIHINGTMSSDGEFYFDSFQTNSGAAVFSAEITGYTDKPSFNSAIVLQSSPNQSTWTSAAIVWMTSHEPKSVNVVLDNTLYYRVRLLVRENSVFTNATIKPQLEYGNSATAFEPYVGGVASPNPDYPQTVNVVTGTQTIKTCGKNLFDFNGWASVSPTPAYDISHATANQIFDNGIIVTGDTSTATAAEAASKGWFRPAYSSSSLQYRARVGAISDITVSADVTLLSLGYDSLMRIYLYGTNDYYTSAPHNLTLNTKVRISQTFTNVDIGDYYPIFTLASNQVKIENIQIEIGSTDTTFESYQGSTFNIELNTTELCKIGTYQDYIYKSGGDWYIHKETNNHTFNGSENWFLQTSGTPSVLYCGSSILPDAINSAVKTQIYSDHFHHTNVTEVGGCYLYNRSVFVFYGDTSMTAASFKTWLSTNNTIVYYPLATPTDTKITDNTLIGQLNALNAMKLFVGENNIWVVKEASLQPTLELSYYSEGEGDSLGFVWEEGSGGGVTTLQVDSIDDVYPIWEIEGPANNPQLSNITTATILSYNGNIPLGQKLVVDMFNKTAKLNGTSVVNNISGDWVYFKPGNNRITYITDNNDATDSVISWQEVVG